MAQKPGDFFLTIIDFLGILVPGVVLVFLHGDLLLRPFGLSVGNLQQTPEWTLGLFLGYILGHFLLGFSVPLNWIAIRLISKPTREYFAAVRNRLTLPAGVPETESNIYYSAFSFVRLQSAAAIGEVERQAAEYKLFRSLTLLFIIDIPLAAVAGRLTVFRLGASLVLAVLAFYRFQWLLDWAYRLTADFYLQIRAAPAAERP